MGFNARQRKCLHKTLPPFSLSLSTMLFALQYREALPRAKKMTREMRHSRKRGKRVERQARKAHVYVYTGERAGETDGGEGRAIERIAFAYCARGLPRIMPD